MYNRIVVYGGYGNDTIHADSTIGKPMEIHGGAGDDWIRGGTFSDKLYGGTNGTSTVFESGNDRIEGMDGNDFIRGSVYGNNHLRGGVGKDSVYGGQGRDTIYGDAGDDSLSGSTGNDYLYGGNDTDALDGGGGNDLLDGGWGNDVLNGGTHNDSLYGGYGDDLLMPSSGADLLKGGSGWDTLDHSSSFADLRITQDNSANDGAATGEGDNVWYDIECILAGSGDDFISGGAFNNWIVGGAGADSLEGGFGHDTVLGGVGDDEVHGNAGNDWVYGEDGDDRLFAGAGDDVVQGQGGNDTLVSIGGGTLDRLFGQTGLDSFWMDAEGTETSDSSSTERNARCVHRVASFANGAGRELNGEDIGDPALIDSSMETWMANQPTDNNPLFSSIGPQPDDINQGTRLGDCWFLATLAAMADKDPNFIRQSVVDLGEGTYGAMFYDEGEPRFYRVDNDLPVLRGSSTLAYAQPGFQGAMWGPILEKAYALHAGEAGGEGEYAELDGGWPQDAFTDLNLGSDEMDVDDDGVLQLIATHLAAGRPVTIGTVAGDFNMGDSIVMSHAYMVKSVDLGAGTITLYNPWGSDAGGGFVSGADDGWITFTWNQNFRDLTEDFTVGNV
jgi:hypothetical protein